jgi:hypothetical protein
MYSLLSFIIRHVILAINTLVLPKPIRRRYGHMELLFLAKAMSSKNTRDKTRFEAIDTFYHQ